MLNLLAFTRRSVKNPPTIQDLPESGRSPEEGKGNPFQYSCLGSPMDRGAQSMGSQRVRLTKRLTLSPRKYLSQMETKSPSSFVQISLVTQSCLTLYWPHGLQHARLPCPSPTPRAYSNSCPSSQWCHPAISFSVVPSSSHLQSFPASGSFPMSQFFASGGQSIGVSLQHQSFQWTPRTNLL